MYGAHVHTLQLHVSEIDIKLPNKVIMSNYIRFYNI